MAEVAVEQGLRERLEAIAATGQAPGAGISSHDHSVLIYWDDQELLDALVPYLVEGLQQGDRVVHVGHRAPLSVIASGLESAGVDVEASKATGQLTLVTAEQAFFPAGRFELEAALAGVRQLAEGAQADGVKRVRFSVDLAYLLANVPGMEDGLTFESRANEEIFERYPFMCICSYNASLGQNEIVEDLLATHPVVFVRGLPLANPYYRPWKELSAEALRIERWKKHCGLSA